MPAMDRFAEKDFATAKKLRRRSVARTLAESRAAAISRSIRVNGRHRSDTGTRANRR